MLARIAWSFAALDFRHSPLREALASSAIRRCSAFGPQDIANTAWAFAALQFHVAGRPLLDAISAAAIAKLSGGASSHLHKPQDACLERTVGSCQQLLRCVDDGHCIAQASGQFSAHNLAATAWASAVLKL